MKEISKKDVVILCGDSNAKIGKTSVEWQDIIGNYGFGERNERKERLLQFAMENDLVVAKYTFQTQRLSKMDMEITKWQIAQYD